MGNYVRNKIRAAKRNAGFAAQKPALQQKLLAIAKAGKGKPLKAPTMALVRAHGAMAVDDALTDIWMSGSGAGLKGASANRFDSISSWTS